ncbi:porin [Lichenibacterium dinghuense]|uniref:porin n=1 Tax=Lichenibacterium dinghuense TaxID=2895977 RepID=UPI001F15D51E|nr:porin [Lichenibacterium sp. 6Y81]
MTGLKVTLLASAIALVGANAALAADLPVAKAAPVDYVRVCDWTGAGFFYIPGTDTCLAIGAQVRTEAAFINNSRAFYPTGGNNVGGTTGALARTVVPGRDRDEAGFLARMRLGVDTRTQTAYGTLRAYVQYQIDRLQGVYGAGGASGGSNTFTNQGGNNAVVRRGFIQFAGITAGRVQSFFDFYADNYNYEGLANSDQNQNVFAYTYQVGGGLAATLSIEDRNGRNLPNGIGSITGAGTGLVQTARYAGETIPDIVGVLRYDQTWGSAQLSAAYHDITTTQGGNSTGNGFPGTGGEGFSKADADGFAVQGGLRIKLPMLAAGDDLWLEGAYQQGAYLYQDSGTGFNQSINAGLAAGGFIHIDKDAVAIHPFGTPAAFYRLSEGKGFNALFAFNHYFSPNFHDVVFGSYEQISYGGAVKNTDWTRGGIGDASEYRVGNQFLWDPVKNLELGLEVDYIHIDQTLAHEPGRAPTALPTGVAVNPDGFEVRFRMERDF